MTIITRIANQNPYLTIEILKDVGWSRYRSITASDTSQERTRAPAVIRKSARHRATVQQTLRLKPAEPEQPLSPARSSARWNHCWMGSHWEAHRDCCPRNTCFAIGVTMDVPTLSILSNRSRSFRIRSPLTDRCLLIPVIRSFSAMSCTMELRVVRPGGTIDNSPAIYRWVRDTD